MAQGGISDRESRFCGFVSWTEGAGNQDWTTPRTLENQDEQLETEANRNPAFKRAWKEAARDPNLFELKRKYNTLMESDIKLIMAYTYNLPGLFYYALNKDCRERGQKYPIAKRALCAALIKLHEIQEELPEELYRKEGFDQMDKYVTWKKGKREQTLDAFTSTSRKETGFAGHGGVNLNITIKNPINGADISMFSPFPDEKEVLLIPGYDLYKVTGAAKSTKKVVMIYVD